jgi:hypothetical protein
MWPKSSLLLAACLALGTAAPAVESAEPDLPSYSVVDLRALGVWPADMNGRGQVVGRGVPNAVSSNFFRTYLYSDGDVLELDPPGETFRLLIGDGGHVAGVDWVYDGSAYRRIDPPLPDEPGFVLRDMMITALNATGQLVGSAGYVRMSPLAGLTIAWTDDSAGVRNLSRPPGADYCYPDDINAGGDVTLICPLGNGEQIAGATYADGSWHPVHSKAYQLWINDARALLVNGYVFGPSYLIDGAGEHPLTGSAVAFNNLGEVISETWDGPDYRAYLGRDGASVEIGPAGRRSSRPQSINGDGAVVGSYRDATERIRAFVHWQGNSLDLSELRGVGAVLDTALAEANTVSVEIGDAWQILLVATMDPPVDPDPTRLTGAYLLSPVAPVVAVTASAAAVAVGTPVHLGWTSTDANTCVASGGVAGDGWAGPHATTGQLEVTSGTSGVVHYSMRCRAGPVSGEHAVAVSFTRRPPTVSLTASPAQARVRQSVSLRWTSTDAETCAATGGQTGDGWTGTLATDGETQVRGMRRGAAGYGIHCTAGDLEAEARATVTFTKRGGGSLDALGLLLLGAAAARALRRTDADRTALPRR